MKKSVVIGSGFAGLASASLIAKAGHEVTLVEKNSEVGGRARKFEAEGFIFDMGPSWYWMPDVFERYYNYFGKTASDFYELQKLDPAFRLFFPDQTLDMPGEPDGVYDFFEQLEPGSTEALQSFMKDAAFKYEVGVHDIIYRQPDGLKPFLNWKVMSSAARLQLLKAISKHIASYFDHPYLRQVLEFPVLFLGADPKETPALYSMMDYAGLMLGTWYPQGGMNEIVKAMESIALENGVHIQTENEVLSLTTDKNSCSSLHTKNGSIDADAFVIAGDYQHFDRTVMPDEHKQYSKKYWDNRTMAPSCLLYYIGCSEKIEGLEHHNLFFDTDFAAHSQAIYKTKDWPESPLFYVCCPSKTDAKVAQQGHENIFMLVPIAAGLEDTKEVLDHYFGMLCDRIKERTGTDIRDSLVYRRDYSVSDFKKDYYSYKGNAYGLANTLRQTAFLKPRMKHKSLRNVFHAGQLTVPGPGVPPSLVSGELAANYVNDYLSKLK